MRKKKNILVRNCIGKDEITVVRVSESPFIHLLAAIRGVEIKDDMEFPYLLKVDNINSVNIDKALIIKNFKEDIEEKFDFYMATSSQVKTNSAWFVREDIINDIKNLEWFVSSGKLFELEGQEICINKDIIGRLSLLFTGSYKTSIKPNIIVVSDVEYSVFKNVKVFENNELIDKDNFEISNTAFDGAGLASPEIFKEISKELKMDYIPSWITCRIPQMAIKGLLTNVDFQRYFKDKYTGDTDFFKKIENNFYIKDKWNNFIKVDDNTIIINESMAKWSKWYDSIDEFNIRMKDYDKFLDITSSLYVAKYAKNESKKYTKTSYQSLCAMAITPQAIERLSKPEVEFYHRILNNDKIAIFEFLNFLCDSDEDEVKLNSDKLVILLSRDFDRFIVMPWVKKTLSKMIEKSIKGLMTGRISVKGNFKVLIQDPIAFLNYCIKGSIIPELKEDEFYVKGEVGRRAAIRYPVASPYELDVKKLVENYNCNKYCNFNNEIFVLNVLGIDLLRASGADTDGDMFQIIDNEDIINSIIQTDRLFINRLDGGSKKVIYSKANRKSENLIVKGNLIGTIALTASTIGDECLNLNYFIDNNKILNLSEIREKYNDNWEVINSKRIDKILNEDKLREFFINKFKHVETEINKCVELSMVAIDAAKTGIMPNKEELKFIKDKYIKKPGFFVYIPGKDYSRLDCSFSCNSVITNYCGFLMNTLYKRFQLANNRAAYINSNIIKSVLEKALLLDVNIEEVNSIKEIIGYNYKIFNGNMTLLKAKNENKYGFEEDRFNIEEKREIYNNICLEQELLAIELYNSYIVENIAYALASFILDSSKKNSHRYIFNFYFNIINELLDIEYDSIERLVENENGKYKGCFKKYNLIKVNNNKVNLKFLEITKNNIERRLENEIQLRIRLNNPDVVILDNVEIRNLDVITNNKVIGGIFSDSITKNKKLLSDIQGIVKVKNLIKSTSRKSGTLIIRDR